MHFAKIENFINVEIAHISGAASFDDKGKPIDVEKFVGFQTNVEFCHSTDDQAIRYFIDDKIKEALDAMEQQIYSHQPLQVALCVVTTGIVNRFLYKETEKRLYYFDCMEREVKYRNLENLETIELLRREAK